MTAVHEDNWGQFCDQFCPGDESKICGGGHGAISVYPNFPSDSLKGMSDCYLVPIQLVCLQLSAFCLHFRHGCYGQK